MFTHLKNSIIFEKHEIIEIKEICLCGTNKRYNSRKFHNFIAKKNVFAFYSKILKLSSNMVVSKVVDFQLSSTFTFNFISFKKYLHRKYRKPVYHPLQPPTPHPSTASIQLLHFIPNVTYHFFHSFQQKLSG